MISSEHAIQLRKTHAIRREHQTTLQQLAPKLAHDTAILHDEKFKFFLPLYQAFLRFETALHPPALGQNQQGSQNQENRCHLPDKGEIKVAFQDILRLLFQDEDQRRNFLDWIGLE